MMNVVWSLAGFAQSQIWPICPDVPSRILALDYCAEESLSFVLHESPLFEQLLRKSRSPRKSSTVESGASALACAASKRQFHRLPSLRLALHSIGNGFCISDIDGSK